MKKFLFPFFCTVFLLSDYTLLAQEVQIEVTQIAPKVYVHTSYRMFGDVKFPSHGLLISTTEGVVMIDTGWGNEPTVQLLGWIKDNLKQSVKMCIVTHAHDDRVGGLATLKKHNIVSFSSVQTAELAKANGLGDLDPTLPLDQELAVGDQRIVVYFPGGGHTPDNLVVYLPKQKILFGGCLVKDVKATNLGNTADAEMGNWANAIRNVKERFPKAKVIIPSHGPWGDQKALNHTLELLQKQ